MSSLRRAVAAAVTLSCLPLLAAQAFDPVDRSRVGAVTLELVDGSGATLHVALRVWDVAGGDRVDARVESCDATGCAYPVFYSGAVDAAAADIDPTEATGRAVVALAGRELSLTWSPGESSGVVVSTGEVTAAGESATGGMYVGAPAVVHVAGAGVDCTTTGAVGDGLRLTLPEGSAGATRPLEALRLPAGPLGCATG